MLLRPASARRVGWIIPDPPAFPPAAIPAPSLTPPASRLRRPRAGFTLLEILLTLALIALLAAALIGGSSALIAERAPSANDVFWTAVRAARKSALNTRQEIGLRFDEKTKAFVLSADDPALGRTFPIPGAPADLAVDFLAAQRTGGSILLGGTVVETEPLTGGVTFFSDGTCSAFRLQIRLNGGASIIAIDPWTCAPVIPPAPNP